MLRLTESAIEDLAIEHPEVLGYRCLYGADIALDSDTPKCESFEDVLLLARLETWNCSQINTELAYFMIRAIRVLPRPIRGLPTREQVQRSRCRFAYESASHLF